MTQAPELDVHLSTPERIKQAFGMTGLFSFGGKKKAARIHDQWSRAEKKGVAVTQTLRRMEVDDNEYEIKAFSTGGDIAPATLARLTAEAAAIDGTTFRSSAYLYDSFSEWRGSEKLWIRKYPAIRDLSIAEEGTYTFPLTLLDGDGATDYVAWAFIDGELFIGVLYNKNVG